MVLNAKVPWMPERALHVEELYQNQDLHQLTGDRK